MGVHFLCDYPLQGDFLARGKNHKNPINGVPWYQCLLAHSFIHSLGVYLVTGNIILALMELIAHFCIDYGKNAGLFGYNFDQALHFLCKILWVILLNKVMRP